MQRILCLCIFMVFMCVTSVSAALRESDKVMLNDMHAHPKNYILYGGAGTGASLWLSKPSIDVQQYNPPHYIIAVRSIFYAVGPNNQEYAGSGTIKRYRYDIDEHKMYEERYDEKDNNKPYWQYLDPMLTDQGNASGWPQSIAAAEITFYLAYNTTFFSRPISYYAKNYILERKGTFDARH